MISLVGAALICAAAAGWGYEKSKRESAKLSVLEGLLAFVNYTEEQISSYRTPLFRIFSDFEDEELEKCGFLKRLREEGIKAAVEGLSDKIPKESLRDMESFSRELGGGYSDAQTTLCRVTASHLEGVTQKLRSTLPERQRMYRLLPLLCALSVIILLI